MCFIFFYMHTHTSSYLIFATHTFFKEAEKERGSKSTGEREHWHYDIL